MEDLYLKVIEKIDEMFGDMSVSQEETKNNLNGVIDHCENLKESLGDVE